MRKLPSIPYLAFSPGRGSHDSIMSGEELVGRKLVITTKMDGSHVAIQRQWEAPASLADRSCARPTHPAFDRLKARVDGLAQDLLYSELVFGEWLYARHTIHYKGDLALPDYLMVFAVWLYATGRWESWDGVCETAERMWLPTVPWTGQTYTWPTLRALREGITEVAENMISQGHEGVVVRGAERMSRWEGLGLWSAKYVRSDHVQSEDHWMQSPLVPNELSKGDPDGR